MITIKNGKYIMTTNIRFPIGTKFYDGNKHKRVATIVDILRTYNSKDELINVRYVATHEFLGQIVTNRDVCDARVAMNLLPEFQHLLEN